MLWISGELKGKSEIRSSQPPTWKENLTWGSTWTSVLGQINSSVPAVVKVQLSPAGSCWRWGCDLRISLGLLYRSGCWLLALQLAAVLKSKVQERKTRKHPREPQRHCQSESSRKLRACCSISSATCQVQLWSVWSLQIKEQGSACYTLTASKLKKSLYKMNLYFSRFGKGFHLALLLARWAHCLLKPREQDRWVKHSSFINRAQQEGQAGLACLCCASSLWTGISISRAVHTAPFKDSEFSLETGR